MEVNLWVKAPLPRRQSRSWQIHASKQQQQQQHHRFIYPVRPFWDWMWVKHHVHITANGPTNKTHTHTSMALTKLRSR